jgi:hypothetical protein
VLGRYPVPQVRLLDLPVQVRKIKSKLGLIFGTGSRERESFFFCFEELNLDPHSQFHLCVELEPRSFFAKKTRTGGLIGGG